MTIRNDISIDWGASPRIIEVAAPSIELTVQDLYDTTRSKAASDEGIDEPEIIDGSGKEILSETESVGLTVKLFNAKVKFEDRSSPTDCEILGGNLVALNENGQPMNPIQYATYVTVAYAKSSSATLVQSAVIDEIKAKTDSLPQYPASEDTSQAIQGKTDNLPEEPADQSLIEEQVEAAFSEIKGPDWSEETLKEIREATAKISLQAPRAFSV